MAKEIKDEDESSHYVTLDFSNHNNKNNGDNHHSEISDQKIEIEEINDKMEKSVKKIIPPPRHQYSYQQNKQKSITPPPRSTVSIPTTAAATTPAINHHLHIHHPSTTRIHSNDPALASLNVKRQPETSSEDPRDFATFLCIFAIVMTIVLVLMFYVVGEQAFRLILLVVSFVSILTLCLACFLRRPTLVILGQTISAENNHHSSISNNNQSIKEHYNSKSQSQPYLLIFPTLFGQNADPVDQLQKY